jgi:23S rRNA (adenine2030-N6)-methyltransferase
VLSYQHRYHAGGFADVHKHLLLAAVLRTLRRKETGFTFVDSHAGEGTYDLKSAEATKLGESAQGILRLSRTASAPPAIMDYFGCLHAENGDGPIRYYPGSARIAEHLSRPQDELIFIELHPQAFEHLRRRFRRQPRAHIHKRDALEALRALLPPHRSRGLVLIDPSYEDKGDYAAVVNATTDAWRRWNHGVFMVWYPLLPDGRHQPLIDGFARSGFSGIVRSEWELGDAWVGKGLLGSGVLLVNPPWKIDERIQVLSDWLTRSGFLKGPARLDGLPSA